MPLYEYQCEKCGHRFEVIQKFSDQPIAVCPSCGQGPVEKLLSSPAIQFKGTGWYITDYARKGQSGTSASTGATGGKGESGSGSASESAGDKPAADSSAPKTESKPAESSSKKD